MSPTTTLLWNFHGASPEERSDEWVAPDSYWDLCVLFLCSAFSNFQLNAWH